MPKDILSAIERATKNEVKGSRARYAMDIVCENIKLAKEKSQPVCQDTGSILFFVKTPKGFDQHEFEEAARWAVAEATTKGFLRQNSVDSLTGKNTGNNLGPGNPYFHFEQTSPPLERGVRGDLRSALSSKAAAARTAALNTVCQIRASTPSAISMG